MKYNGGFCLFALFDAVGNLKSLFRQNGLDSDVLLFWVP